MESNAYRRAAIVVASLDRDAADAILDRMPEERARAIRDELIRLDELSPAEQESAINEFMCDRVDRPMESARPNRNSTSPEASSRVLSSSLQDLVKHDDESIASALMHERTSVLAALLISLPGKRAAGVLRLFPGTTQLRVVKAMNLQVSPRAEAVDVVADLVCDKRAEFDAEQLGLQHQDALQAIFDELSPAERRAMLQDIRGENPMLAQRLSEGITSVEPTASPHTDDCYC